MPMTGFRPQEHGFHFVNYFVNHVGPFTTQGRCGGMSYAALDCFTHGVAVPPSAHVPTDGHDLASWHDNRLDLFVRGTDGRAYHRSLRGDGWDDWGAIGGTHTSPPTGIAWGRNRLDVFSRGTDNALWHKRFDGTWHDWESLGGTLTSGPDACSWAPGRIDVFARGLDNGLWHKWFDRTWHDWESLGGQITSDPAAVSWGLNRIDVFARGLNNSLVHKWFDGTWHDWESLGGTLTSGPDACSWEANRLDVFARGTDNALWHRSWDGNSWRDWKSLGGILSSDPSAVSRGPNRIDVVFRGSDHNLWRLCYDGSWQGQRRVDQDVPVDGHPVADYIYGRQLDSLASVVPGYIGRLAPWNDDRARFNWSVQEADELGRLRPHIDAGNPVNLALFAVKDKHHQVLAIGYDFDGPNGNLRVHVYDPNVPEQTVVFTANPAEYRFDTSVGGAWRGYFVDEGYQRRRPTF